MKRIGKNLFVFVLFVVFMSLCLVGCSESTGDADRLPSMDKGTVGDSSTYASTTEATPDRKVIYSVSVSYTVDALDDCEKTVASKLKNDEWISGSNVSKNYATIVARIKTERLDEFLSSLDGLGEMTYYNKTSDDISEKYYDNSVRKTALENEQSRLLALQSSATSLADLIAINTRLSEIEAELATVNGTLNKYDSLVEYSTVTVTLSIKNQYSTYTFWDELADGLSVSWEIAKGLAILIVCIIPYGLVGSGIFFLIRHLVRRKRVKKSAEKLAVNEMKEPKGD